MPEGLAPLSNYVLPCFLLHPPCLLPALYFFHFMPFLWEHLFSKNLQSPADPLPGEVAGDSNEVHSRSHSIPQLYGWHKKRRNSLLCCSFSFDAFLLSLLPHWSRIGLLKLHNRFTAWQIHLTLHYTAGALACCLQAQAGKGENYTK